MIANIVDISRNTVCGFRLKTYFYMMLLNEIMPDFEKGVVIFLDKFKFLCYYIFILACVGKHIMRTS